MGGMAMATEAGRLTAIKIKNAGVGRHFDGGGLYLDVRANGAGLRACEKLGIRRAL
jgi:hypothetical protein